jgi:hypothetical protein
VHWYHNSHKLIDCCHIPIALKIPTPLAHRRRKLTRTLLTTPTRCRRAKPGYNPQRKGAPTTIRICTVLCFAVAVSVIVTAQTEPVLVSVNIPKHPPLACQARIERFVKLTFTLGANAAEPTDVEVVSGHPLLKGAAVEHVKTWRFKNPYAVARKYETTFDYRLPSSGPQKVTFESFDRVEILTCLPALVEP